LKLIKSDVDQGRAMLDFAHTAVERQKQAENNDSLLSALLYYKQRIPIYVIVVVALSFFLFQCDVYIYTMMSFRV
jgi:hypothetical protein